MSLRMAAPLILVLLLAAPAAAQNQTLAVTAHDDGGEYFFTVEGLEGRNPTIELPPGAQVDVQFTNAGPASGHNLHFGPPIDESTEVIPPGESRTLSFTVPADAGAAEYWCDPHRSQGMTGDVSFGGEDEAGNGAPGIGILLSVALLAAALLARRH